MDLYTRQVVSFDVHDSMDANWVANILKRLINEFPKVELIHSDRGSQYKSNIYKKVMVDNNLI